MAGEQGNFFSTGDISQLVNGVNAVLTTMHMTNDEAIYSKIAFVDNGSTTGGKVVGTPAGGSVAGVQNGSGQAGELMNYPMSPVSQPGKAWPTGVSRGETQPLVVNAYVTRQRYGIDTELIDLDTQDPYGLLSGKQGMIISRAGRSIDVLGMVDTINGNHSTTYDGLTFFHTARPIKPGSAITFSNDVTCTNAQWATGDGFVILLDAIAKIPWFDGMLKDGAMRKPLILCPTNSTMLKVMQLTGFGLPDGMALIPQAVDAGGGKFGVGTGTSPYKGRVMGVELFEDLANPTVYPNSDQYVYAIATMGGALQPAFIVSPKRMPYMNVYGLDSSDEVRRKFGSIGWDWDGFWGVGYGLPQCVVRMRING